MAATKKAPPAGKAKKINKSNLKVINGGKKPAKAKVKKQPPKPAAKKAPPKAAPVKAKAKVTTKKKAPVRKTTKVAKATPPTKKAVRRARALVPVKKAKVSARTKAPVKAKVPAKKKAPVQVSTWRCVLRLPQSKANKVKRGAKKYDMSMNSLIESILDIWIDGEKEAAKNAKK